MRNRMICAVGCCNVMHACSGYGASIINVGIFGAEFPILNRHGRRDRGPMRCAGQNRRNISAKVVSCQVHCFEVLVKGDFAEDKVISSNVLYVDSQHPPKPLPGTPFPNATIENIKREKFPPPCSRLFDDFFLTEHPAI